MNGADAPAAIPAGGTISPGHPSGGHFSALLASVPDADAAASGRRPVVVLTGFLGSGKTTLVNRLLRLPALAGTAVIVNEFGDVGIDQDLIAEATDDTILLANGCLCCAVRGDLIGALERLAARTEPPLERVLIETSGLADPGPILRTLIADGALRRRFRLAGVVCTVDAVLGAATLDRHPEAVRQVAVADRLLLTKTDLVADPASSLASLRTRLAAINPRVERVEGADAALASVLEMTDQEVEAVSSPGGGSTDPHEGGAPHYRPVAPYATDAPPTGHRDGISSFVVTHDRPLPRAAFAAWLDMVAAMRGEDLLRIKGLVAIDEHPDRPLVVHGVQHLFQPPETLARWPDADRRTRIVFITRGLDGEALQQTLDVAVRRHLRRPTAAGPASQPEETPT